MFTPIVDLDGDLQAEVLGSLDIPAEWEATWDVGLTDPGDTYGVRPLWGRFLVEGRWPAAFALGHRGDPRPWRIECHVAGGHGCPHPASVDLRTVGVSPFLRAGPAPLRSRPGSPV